MSSDDIVALLNDLIRVSLDGRKGYAEAAEYAQAPTLKSLFILRSGEFALAASELQFVVQTFGREPVEEGSMAGAAHRGWIKLRPRTALQHNNAAVLGEIERGELHACRAYAEALHASLPPEVDGLVHRQFWAIRRNCREVHSLRRRYQRTAA